jgi:predicted alpha/beta superfamily hydrolase
MRRTYDFSFNDVWSFEGFGRQLVEREKAASLESWKAAGIALPEKFGGAPGFLEFMVDVVRPALARDFRMSGEHVLFGDSMGGLFCTYALLTHPDAFEKYICGSPALSLGNSEVFRIEERYATKHSDLRAEVFFGAGAAEVLEGGGISAGGILSATARMAEILRARSYPSLRLHFQVFPGEDHSSVVPLNLSWGLRSVFSGTRSVCELP